MRTLQTPISFIGGTKRVARLWPSERRGWRLWLRRSGVVLAMGGMWLASLAFYTFLAGFLILAPVWLIYTQARRHAIHRDEALAAIRDSKGSTS